MTLTGVQSEDIEKIADRLLENFKQLKTQKSQWQITSPDQRSNSTDKRYGGSLPKEVKG